MMRVISTSWTEARMVWVRSTTTSTSMAGEIDSCRRGRACLHVLDGRQDVRAWLPPDDHQHRPLAIDPGRPARLFSTSS